MSSRGKKYLVFEGSNCQFWSSQCIKKICSALYALQLDSNLFIKLDTKVKISLFSLNRPQGLLSIYVKNSVCLSVSLCNSDPLGQTLRYYFKE